jgi:hypothetical protein
MFSLSGWYARPSDSAAQTLTHADPPMGVKSSPALRRRLERITQRGRNRLMPSVRLRRHRDVHGAERRCILDHAADLPPLGRELRGNAAPRRRIPAVAGQVVVFLVELR